MPREIEVKSVLNIKKHRDAWFLDDYTANLYSSCAFNCLYCYIRGSKYGSNLETSLSVKINAIELLDRQLFNRAKKNQQGIVVLSSATDPYLGLEKSYKLTRQALELLLKYRFPVHIITKSDLVERDFDLLEEIDHKAIIPKDLEGRISGSFITFSFSTLDDHVGKVFEPGAPKPSVRLETLRKARESGFLSGVSLMPLLPFISDTAEHLEHMFGAFREADARYVMPSTITLFGNDKADSKTLVLGAVEKHFPELSERYHRYFDHSQELPHFYREAFHRKMKELSLKYAIPDRIVH